MTLRVVVLARMCCEKETLSCWYWAPYPPMNLRKQKSALSSSRSARWHAPDLRESVRETCRFGNLGELDVVLRNEELAQELGEEGGGLASGDQSVRCSILDTTSPPETLGTQ